jgi:polysaccharide pyruvyl transferase WcaK-like protein
MFRLYKYYLNELKSEVFMLKSGLSYVFTLKKRGIYIGCMGMGNLGDEAVFYATKNLIKSKVHLYSVPYFKPFSGRVFRKLFFKPPNYIILGGGTLILKSKTESFLRIVLKYHKLYPKAELLVLGTGVADINLAKQNGFPTNIKDWCHFLSLCSFISVRGEISKESLKNPPWSIHNDVIILHDPAIFYHRNIIKRKQHQKRIALNFCDIAGRIYGQNQPELDVFFRNLVLALIKDNWNIYLYPTVSSDIDFMRKKLGETIYSQLSVYNNYIDLDKSLAFLSSMDIFIGQRLHSIIFAAVTNTPFFAIEYESKTSDFLVSLGIQDRCMRTNNLNLSLILNSINLIYNNLDVEQDILYKHCSKAKQNQLASVNEFLANVK